MHITAVYRAYSNRDDVALAEALASLRCKLISDVLANGPAAVVLDLSQHPSFRDILNKIEAEANVATAGCLAFLAGFFSAYRDYLALMVDRDAVDAADAQLSADRDAHVQVDLVRMIVLKTTFAHSGARAKDLVGAVSCAARVSESSVKFHLRRLAELKLIERLELGPKAVSYRISRLGEAVLARRSKPHELALFLVDQAAHDEALRAAMESEIARTWPQSFRRQDDELEQPHLRLPTPRGFATSGSSSLQLNRLYREYQKEVAA